MTWTDRDRGQIESRGMTVEQVEEQLERFRHGFPALVLDRPCTLGDGLRRIHEPETIELEARFREARLEGRVSKFVPASGAASRMFHPLLVAYHDQGPLDDDSLSARNDSDGQFVLEFFRRLEEFPFAPALHALLADVPEGDGSFGGSEVRRQALRQLLSGEGLGYGEIPKGLIPFHQYGNEIRTAFEEHLVESLAYVRGGDGSIRLHFTVPQADQERISGHVQAFAERLRERFGLSFSAQDRSSDTIAVAADNEPVRDSQGHLVFRPGGHGALLRNLESVNGDLVFIRNIDNIAAERPLRPLHVYRERLGGILLEIQERIAGLLDLLEAEEVTPELLSQSFDFVERILSRTPAPAVREGDTPGQTAFLIEQLSRPFRVCGMVRNDGEPGGGPFWVRHRDGSTSIQIVEKSQIEVSDSGQHAILEASTHFNPVDLVCALRGRDGRPYRLAGFVDSESGLITEKTGEGRVVRALEWPGLWNGAMARWNTVFVEMPFETFNPVKTVLDLLRPAHRS